MTARAARSAALRRVRGARDPPRPARRTYDIPPAERADGPFETLPARPHDPRAGGGATRSSRRSRADAHAARPSPMASVRPRMERAPAGASCGEGRPTAGEPARRAQPHPRSAQERRAAGKAAVVAEGDLSGAARDIVRMAREAGVVVQFVERYRLIRSIPPIRGCWPSARRGPTPPSRTYSPGQRKRARSRSSVVLDQVDRPAQPRRHHSQQRVRGGARRHHPERRAAGLTPRPAKRRRQERLRTCRWRG